MNNFTISLLVTPPKCVENAAFIPCGSSCPPTCEAPKPVLCSQRCEVGCFCKPGFLKTKDGACVTPDQCKTSKLIHFQNESTNQSMNGPEKKLVIYSAVLKKIIPTPLVFCVCFFS